MLFNSFTPDFVPPQEKTHASFVLAKCFSAKSTQSKASSDLIFEELDTRDVAPFPPHVKLAERAPLRPKQVHTVFSLLRVSFVLVLKVNEYNPSSLLPFCENRRR